MGRKSPLPGICGSWCSVMPFGESDCHTPSPPDLAHPVGRHPVPAVQQAIGRCYFPLARQVGVDDLHDLPLISGIPCGDQHSVTELRGFCGGSPTLLTRPADLTRGIQVLLGSVSGPRAGSERRHRAERLTAVMDRELAMADAAIARTRRQLQHGSPARMPGRTDRTLASLSAPLPCPGTHSPSRYRLVADCVVSCQPAPRAARPTPHAVPAATADRKGRTDTDDHYRAASASGRRRRSRRAWLPGRAPARA